MILTGKLIIFVHNEIYKMRGVNKVFLIGHLGKDPEVRHLEGGNTVANFPLATSESYTTKDGNKVDQTEWHNIVIWRKLAEIAEKYLKKGSLIYLEGRIRTRSWDDKEGNKRYITEIVAINFQMLDKREDSGQRNVAPVSNSSETTTSNNTTSSNTKTENVVFDEPGDDLPF